MMKSSLLVLALVACGPKQTTNVSNTTAGSGSSAGPVTDTRTEIERRRDAACETLGPKITACALEDAKRGLAEGKVKQKDYDETTKPEILKKNTEKYIDKCKHPETPYSSRQIRVLEVCQQAESQCEPLLACLDNIQPRKP